jgi:ATP-dependent Lhr-like helicase
LARWQHLAPSARLRGEGALTRVVQQLRALPVVGQAWERDVLPLRMAHYRAPELDALCQGGELVWVGSGGVDPRRGRVRFLFRGEGQVYLEPLPEEMELEPPAQAVYDFLRSEGAAFFGDVRAATELSTDQVETALIELVMAGLVTNDSLEAMRQIVQRGSPRPPAPKPLSSLEEQLARRRQRLGARARPLGQRPGPAQYRAAKRRVRQRLAHSLSHSSLGTPAAAGPESRWVGRWTLVHRFGVMGKALSDGERTARQARQLLARWGVVTRQSLEGESGAWSWAPIYRQLVRMEMRGEMRRGYFVQGLPGAQFALPEAVEQLRALRDQAHVDPELVVMNAVDPANLYGPQLEDTVQEEILTAGGEPMTFSRVPSTWLVQQAGRPVLVAADSGARITLTEGVDEGLARRALRALLDHLGTFASRVRVETWNGEPVLGGEGQAILESLGFYRDYPAMTLNR